MDFFKIVEEEAKNGSRNRESETVIVFPDFCVLRSKDIMVRGKAFYAVWDEHQKIWLTDEMALVRLVDEELWNYANKLKEKGKRVVVKTMKSFSSGSWNSYCKFIKSMPDNFYALDNKILFANDPVEKTQYASHRLPYELIEGPCKAYNEIMSVLYDPKEREKLEWAVGSIIAGDSKKIQKFVVLYGSMGSGKSTFLNIVQQLFEGYYIAFDAKALAGNNNQFATEVFRNNPLIAIQHDGDLSKIEDNSKLNSIISHEDILINEKHKSQYAMQLGCFLFMGTNRPVKITDSKSGIIRRLIDVHPTGDKIPPTQYEQLIAKVDFELGAIAFRCLQVYKTLGKKYYSNYEPKDMLFQTNAVFNFVEENYFVFKDSEVVQLKQAYTMYKEFCEDSKNSYILPRQIFREDFKAYFNEYAEMKRIGDKVMRSIYIGFKSEMFDSQKEEQEHPEKITLSLDQTESILDVEYAEMPAQYATSEGVPKNKWERCESKLKNLDTKRIHFVKVPQNHIVIDFDLKNDKGEKDQQKNLEAASLWPQTYAEFSKSGAGVHLHYIYDGDVNDLSGIYDESIEIKIFEGNRSLRRMLTFCNNVAIAHISSGLPLKEKGDKGLINYKTSINEKALRTLIVKNLNKEYHAGTKPSIDFIKKILDDAYASGISYDVTDMRSRVLNFAANSTNHSSYCIGLIQTMKFCSETESLPSDNYKQDDMVFFDVEVFPNLFIIVYKMAGEQYKPVKMINPTAQQVGELFNFKLVGFNNRRYDNHILYGAYLGYNNEQIYALSGKLVGKVNNGTFREAYNLSYTDVYDFSNKKQSLKKFEIELGLHHQECGYRWDEPVPEDKWDEVADYCCNDVLATESVFNARKADWAARLILAEITGMTPNNTTNQLATKFIFGNDKNPKLVYTDLSKTFPGYEFKRMEDGKMHNMYRGVDVSLGGYVYSEPGMYSNIPLLDVESLHPNSLINMNYFGEHTPQYKAILDARLAIKHNSKEEIRTAFNGKLEKYISDDSLLDDLSFALKIVINSTYGLSSASFANPMKHPDNVNNIVALRGALFMKTLQDAVQEKGYTVAHIKTDSIKIPNGDSNIIDFCKEFAHQYGYNFEHEATYERMCLVNDAVYIARYATKEQCEYLYGYCPKDNKKKSGSWTATGAQFAHPYIFKKLFSNEEIVFKDLCETKTVTGDSALYLDLNENICLPFDNGSSDDEQHSYRFVGKAGEFCPIRSGSGGGVLYREKAGKYYAATGTSGFRWLESEVVRALHKDDEIDMNYFHVLTDTAIDTISKYGDFEWFISLPEKPKDDYPIGFNENPPIQNIA